MATMDHKAHARLDEASPQPFNALGHRHRILGLIGNPPATSLTSVQALATCATLARSTHALARLLCNSEAFRVVQDHCGEVDPGQLPFDPTLTEDLFTALYMLSEQADQVCTELLEKALA
jgi:hypothetical protein